MLDGNIDLPKYIYSVEELEEKVRAALSIGNVLSQVRWSIAQIPTSLR